MSRNYRRCGGCHRTSRYCDCKDYGNVNFDTKEAVIANKICPTYFGSKCFGFYLTTGDGQTITGPQFQGVAFDGTYMYVSVCDKTDTDGCIIKYKPDGTLVTVGPLISDIGHAKIGYSFADGCLYVAQRLLTGDWTASGMHKVAVSFANGKYLTSVSIHCTISFQTS